jgi:hypothetical protein
MTGLYSPDNMMKNIQHVLQGNYDPFLFHHIVISIIGEVHNSPSDMVTVTCSQSHSDPNQGQVLETGIFSVWFMFHLYTSGIIIIRYIISL